MMFDCPYNSRQRKQVHQVDVGQRSDRSVSSTISNAPQPKRRVRFSNLVDDHVVTTFVTYVDPITDPLELAKMHSSPLERRQYKAEARNAVRKASMDCHDLLLQLHHLFFGRSSKSGNVELMLALLLEWCQNDEHRGLEKIILQGTGVRSSDHASRSKQWAQFLAVADCVVVHGTTKVMEDAAVRGLHSC